MLREINLSTRVSRRNLLKLACATAAGLVLPTCVGTPKPTQTKAAEDTASPEATERESQPRTIEQIAGEMRTLEAKYEPGVLPDASNSEWRSDVSQMLALSYELCGKILPEQPDENPMGTTRVCYTQEELNAAIGNLEGIEELTTQFGGVTFEKDGDTQTVIFAFHPTAIKSYGQEGYTALTLLRVIAMHEWGHRINAQGLLPKEDQATISMQIASQAQEITLTAVDGARMLTKPQITPEPQTGVFFSLNEALNEFEMQVVVANNIAGLKNTPIASKQHELWIRNLNELLQIIGAAPAETFPRLAAKRRAGDPVAIIEELATYVDGTEQLDRKNLIRWGIFTIEFALAGRIQERDLLLDNPSAIESIVLDTNQAGSPV